MIYRTKTYIAGDWEGDQALIEQLEKWNSNGSLTLHYLSAHDLCSARDDSLNCSIKTSLKQRLDASKTFVLIVGAKTNSVTAGSCQHCADYGSYTQKCFRGKPLDFRSYIKYECEYAIKNKLKIVVIYNYASIRKEMCPEVLRHTGTHLNAYSRQKDGNYYWNYQDIKNVLM